MLDNYVVVDLETTGLDPKKDTITQISAVYKHWTFNVFVIPESEITSPYHNYDVERISLGDALNEFRDFLTEIMTYEDEHTDTDFNKSDNLFKWVGQNPTFDLGFAKEVPQFWGLFNLYFFFKPLDVFALAFAAHQVGVLNKNNKLGLKHIYIELFGEEIAVEWHDGLADCKATLSCWYELVKRLGINAQEL